MMTVAAPARIGDHVVIDPVDDETGDREAAPPLEGVVTGIEPGGMRVTLSRPVDGIESCLASEREIRVIRRRVSALGEVCEETPDTAPVEGVVDDEGHLWFHGVRLDPSGPVLFDADGTPLTPAEVRRRAAAWLSAVEAYDACAARGMIVGKAV